MRTLVLLAAMGISIPAAGQDLARELLDRFHGVAWGSLRTAAPGESAFLPGNPEWLYLDELACFRQRQESSGTEGNSDYYALDPAAPACRLLSFRGDTRDLNPQEATTVYDSVRAALERELGASNDPGRVHGWGSAWWRGMRQWDRDGVRILLFVDDGRRQRRVAILAEHRDVLRARESLPRRNLRGEIETALQDEVAFAEMLTGDASTIRAALQRLLDLASAARGERRAALLLAADSVAARLGGKLEDTTQPTLRDLRTETSANLRFEFAYGGAWVYKHDLLERIWRQHENTRWGEAAFVLLQEGGWYFGNFCPADSVYFLKVIENGERFLQRHRNSPHRLETVFQLAQAYEDWWNAGLAPLEDVYPQVPRAKYQPRMQEMRLKAIASYEQVLLAEPQSFRGRWAALRLPRLKLGLHTDGFRFVDSCH